MSDLDSHSKLMDKIYRMQRYIYDVTRKYYLFGRDSLIKIMDLQPEAKVLEVGVGTVRNLILLSRKEPKASYYGVDASTGMLKTAKEKIARAKVNSSISLHYGFAESYDYQKDFNLDEPFDIIFLSYSLSMVSNWKGAIDNALRNLKPGGRLYVVDFWDQAGYPRWFQSFLKWWSSCFHVAFKSEAIEYIESCALDNQAKLKILPIGRRYAYIVSYEVPRSL